MRNSNMIRTRWAAVGAAVAVTLGAVAVGGLNIANADVSSGDRPVFISINPCRLVDTRLATNVGPRSTPIGAAETVTVAAHGPNGECTGASTIPTDAVGLSLNVTAVGPTDNTFLTFWGDGPNPGTSNLNPRAGGAPTPNAVSTPLSATGGFNIFNNAGATNVVVDVNGYYANHDHDDRYELLPTQVIVPASDFQEFSDDPNDWGFEGLWSHGSSASSECINAAFAIPPGQQVTAAELTYEAIGDNDDVSLEVRGFISVPGSHPTTDVVQDVASYTGSIEATPFAGAAVATRLVEGQALTLGPDAASIDPSRYAYSAQVCTDASLIVYSMVVTLAPA
ncbi:MAG: hypothetical protein AB8G14_15340 [Ilumatobacter sp.]